jgi:hypothetical protein
MILEDLTKIPLLKEEAQSASPIGRSLKKKAASIVRKGADGVVI